MIWIISGTQDGREIGAKLADREINKSPEKRQEILMTVVSQYGKVLAAHKGIDVEVGRFKQEDMVRIIKEKHIILILDASHPYAAIVSETARSACKEAGIDYVRFERPEISLPYYDKLYHAKDEFEAAGMAGKLGKSVLLTTGLVGGSDTKLRAAMDAGISVIIIDKPAADLSGFPVFSTQQDILDYMEEYYGFH